MRAMKVLPAVFFGVGLILIGVATYLVIDAGRFQEGAVHAEGTVTSFVWQTRRDHNGLTSRTARPVVAFRVEGREDPIEFEGQVASNPPMYAVGQTVEVLYPPGRPEDARIAGGGLYAAAAVCGLVGVIFLIVPFAIWFFVKRSLRRGFAGMAETRAP